MTIAIPDHVFRGYDLRGIVGSELNKDTVGLLAKGYATWLLQRRIYDCVVGYDCRLSSPQFRDILVGVLLKSGITVYDIGLTLTQIAYFAQYVYKTRGMVMITASHNPKEYNGFKFGTGYSETMLTDEIIYLRELIKSGKFSSLKPEGKHLELDVFPEYLADLKQRVRLNKKFTVVIDSCAATTGLFLPPILRDFGCTVIEQNTKPDGNFPVGTPDPTEKDVLERLAQRVVKEKADVGFAYDADGDRIGIVDNLGTMIWNDTLLSLYAKDVLYYLPGSKIIFNALCSKQVDEVIKKAGGVGIIWKVGHSFIKAKVREERAPFGGELSGHFYFVDNFFGHDDGAIASLRLLSYLDRTGKTLHEEVDALPQYFSSPEIKVGCPDNLKFQIVTDKIGQEMKKIFTGAVFNEIDGVRMDTADEMLIVRASQNGPYLTVKFEGNTQKQYDKLKLIVSEILHKFKEIDFKSGVNTKALDN